MTDVQAITGAENDLEAWGAIENIARTLHVKGADLQATLRAVLAEAVSVTDGTCDAGVNLYVRGRFEPQAVLGDSAPALDEWQQRTGEGPCIQASAEQEIVAVTDMAGDERWPQFCELAQAQGIEAMVCLPLWVDDTRLGSLSLYSNKPQDFDERTRRVAGLLATLAALALADALRAENLRTAVASRDVIGQAKGVLMERHRLTADAAFAQLVAVSQKANRKLVDVAVRLVETGELAP